MTTILDLPNEVLHAICATLTKNEIQRLRLASRTLCLIADEYLLEQVVTCVERDDLATISEIARAPSGIRKGVKSLLIQADAFSGDEVRSRRHWLDERKQFFQTNRNETQALAGDLLSRRKNECVSERLDAFMRYIRYGFEDSLLTRPEEIVSYQKCIDLDADLWNIMNERLDKSILDSLFAACLSITSVTINTGDRLRRNAGLTNLAYLQSLSVPHLLDKCLVNHTIYTTMEAISHAGIDLKRLALAGVEPCIVDHTKILSETTREECTSLLHEVTARLESLRLDFIEMSDCARDGPFEHDETKYITWKFRDGHLVCWLENCHLVRDLRLKLPSAPVASWQVPIEHILGEKAQFEFLDTLHLQYIRSEAEQLAQVLLRYKTTLRSLKISDAHLSKGTWPSFLTLIAGNFERLQHARFAHALSATDDEGFNTICRPTQIGRNTCAGLEKYIITGADEISMTEVFVAGTDDLSTDEEEDGEELN